MLTYYFISEIRFLHTEREIHIDIPLLERADADAGAGGLEGEQTDEERWSRGGRVDFLGGMTPPNPCANFCCLRGGL